MDKKFLFQAPQSRALISQRAAFLMLYFIYVSFTDLFSFLSRQILRLPLP